MPSDATWAPKRTTGIAPEPRRRGALQEAVAVSPTAQYESRKEGPLGVRG
jgi:hypothetical protein